MATDNTDDLIEDESNDQEEEEEEESINVKDMLELQMAEVEMLMSMYPDPNELKIEDPLALPLIRSFLDGNIKYEYLYSRVGFTAYLYPKPECKIELVCHLPHEYPCVKPEIFIRASLISKNDLRQLKDDLDAYVMTMERGDICMGLVLQWIEENASNYIHDTKEAENKSNSPTEKSDEFVRLWIYSHHIFSKFKRRDLVDWGNELKVTGFSMPGKPGVICVEGYSQNVEEYWYRVRRMSWKKIAVKEKEQFHLGDKDLKEFQKFSSFEEMVFDARAGKGREYHMDLGKFYEFLQERDLGWIFSLYFGVEGKSTTN